MKPAHEAVLAQHHVLVRSDNAFQREARLLQALWREERELPIGVHRGRPMGSRIDAAFARESRANFLTDRIRDVVQHAVLGPGRSSDQLIDEERLFSNLLSSQPLCFNLFGELACDLDLASRVLRALAPGRVDRVVEILFEHSPGRGDPRFTGDRSAFDVLIRYVSPTGARGFLGVEVKYHEGLGDPAASHRPRYDEVADAMGCFPADRTALHASPLQQIWRDHLLAGVLAQSADFDDGAFVFLAPEGNVACRRAVAKYRGVLTRDDTFLAWSLESVVDALGRVGAGEAWVAELRARYLDFAKVRERLEAR